MLKLSLIFLLSAVILSLNAQAMTACQSAAKINFLERNNALYNEYQEIDPYTKIITHKKAKWIDGKENASKVLFLAHGYLGTPSEMMYLAKPFQKAGWTIVGFLIPGHGSSAEVSNSYPHERWQEELKAQLDPIVDCFDEVRVAGFSTGGLLLYDYAVQAKKKSSLKSVHLVSPYFLPRIGEWSFLQGLIEFLYDGINADIAYATTHFPDLKVVIVNRKDYNQRLPVKTAIQVSELGKNVYEGDRPRRKSSIPVQLFLSEGDWTVDTKATENIIFSSFSKVDYHWFEGSEPHHLMVPEVSAVAKDIQKSIWDFASKN